MYRKHCVLLHFIATPSSPPEAISNRLGFDFRASFFSLRSRGRFFALALQLEQTARRRDGETARRRGGQMARRRDGQLARRPRRFSDHTPSEHPSILSIPGIPSTPRIWVFRALRVFRVLQVSEHPSITVSEYPCAQVSASPSI